MAVRLPWRLAALTALACLVAAAPRPLAAQAVPVAPPLDTVRLGPAGRRPPGTAAACLSLRVAPGDTVGRAMPRATGDSLADPRMPRATPPAPACEPGRAASRRRELRWYPDGSLRWVPPAPAAPQP